MKHESSPFEVTGRGTNSETIDSGEDEVDEEDNERTSESSSLMRVNEKALFTVNKDAELRNHSNYVALMF